MSCIFSEQHCFLASPAWESVHKRCTEVLSSTERIVLNTLAAMAKLPALLKDFRRLMRSDVRNADMILLLHSRVLAFKSLVCREKVRLSSGLLDPGVVTEIPNDTGEPDAAFLTTIYRFQNADTARRYLLYWSNLIIANQLMERLDKLSTNRVDPSYEWTDASRGSEARGAADNIYRCVDDLHNHRPFGAFAMTFAFPVAFSVDQKTLEPEHLLDRRAWILQSIEKLLGSCGVSGIKFALDTFAEYFTGNVMMV